MKLLFKLCVPVALIPLYFLLLLFDTVLLDYISHPHKVVSFWRLINLLGWIARQVLRIENKMRIIHLELSSFVQKTSFTVPLLLSSSFHFFSFLLLFFSSWGGHRIKFINSWIHPNFLLSTPFSSSLYADQSFNAIIDWEGRNRNREQLNLPIELGSLINDHVSQKLEERRKVKRRFISWNANKKCYRKWRIWWRSFLWSWIIQLGTAIQLFSFSLFPTGYAITILIVSFEVGERVLLFILSFIQYWAEYEPSLLSSPTSTNWVVSGYPGMEMQLIHGWKKFFRWVALFEEDDKERKEKAKSTQYISEGKEVESSYEKKTVICVSRFKIGSEIEWRSTRI